MDWFKQFLVWVDSDASRYGTIAWSCLALTAVLSVAGEVPWLLGRSSPPAGRGWRWFTSRALYVCVVALTVAAFRWPTWFIPEYSNPDESQMIAGAITLRVDPVFWGSVDGTTHGPLDDYALLLPTLFGCPLGFASSRFLGACLHLACLLGVGSVARRFLSETAARIGLLPAITWLGVTTFGDFFQYNSEMVPLALLGLAGAAAAAGLSGTASIGRTVWFVIAGALLGGVPFAKLQAMPIAIVITLVIAGSVAYHARAGKTGAIVRALLPFAAGLFVPALLFAVMLLGNGLFADFWQAYIRSNLLYAKEFGFSWRAALERWPQFMLMVPSYTETFVGHGIAVVLLLVASFCGSKRTRWVLGAAWLVFASAFFAVLAPGRHYMHYLQFVVPASAFLLAAQYQGAREFLENAPARLRWLPAAIIFFAALAPPLYWRWQEPAFFAGRFRDRDAIQPIPAVLIMKRTIVAGDRLAMWGWQPNLYVETSLPQGTREAHTAFQLNSGPLRDYYRTRYLVDFRRNRPAWFVDAVGPDRFCFTERTTYGYETFPELAALVQSDYAFVADVEGYRIYHRK